MPQLEQRAHKEHAVHALVVSREVEPTPGVLHFTVRLVGNPGLGIGVTEGNFVSDLTTGGVAFISAGDLRMTRVPSGKALSPR